ncbi:MAG: hypothetical protein ACNYVW_10015 [Methanosarcinales archaeon]
MKKILLGLVILCMMATSASAITITITKKENWGGSRVVYGYMAINDTYTDTGISLTPRALGLSNITNLVVSDISSPVFGWLYDYDNETVRIYRSENSIFDPDLIPATSDSFTVTDAETPTNEKLLCVSSFSGGPSAHFAVFDAKTAISSATKAYQHFSAADGATTVAVLDTTLSPLCNLDGVSCGDTLYFDEDAENNYSSLMYSGTGMGDRGHLYIPFGDGNYIKVAKQTSLEIYTAGAVALYYKDDSALGAKVIADLSANSGFSVDPYFTALTLYLPGSTKEIPVGTGVNITSVRFIAIGN